MVMTLGTKEAYPFRDPRRPLVPRSPCGCPVSTTLSQKRNSQQYALRLDPGSTRCLTSLTKRILTCLVPYCLGHFFILTNALIGWKDDRKPSFSPLAIGPNVLIPSFTTPLCCSSKVHLDADDDTVTSSISQATPVAASYSSQIDKLMYKWSQPRSSWSIPPGACASYEPFLITLYVGTEKGLELEPRQLGGKLYTKVKA